MNLYTHKALAPEGRYHEIYRNLDIVKALGVLVKDEIPVTYISEIEDKFAKNFFDKHSLIKDNTICVHPGASRPIRAWMPDRFKEIIKRLSVLPNTKVIITWGPGEYNLAHQVSDGLGKNVILSDKTNTIGELAGLIKNSKMFFSNCTGPMNIAVAVRTPVVALLGSSDPTDWGPLGEDHRIIKSSLVLKHYSDEDEVKAMQMITVERVWEVISQRWNEL